MGDITDRLEVAEGILKTLSFAPMRRTALEKKVLRTKDISYSCFSSMFAFLVCDGDIEKVTAEKTAPFKLTEKGKKIKGYRGTKRQSIDRRIKALYQEGWLQKEGVRPAKAHFLSPLYRLSVRARVAMVLSKNDLNRYPCTAPETELKALLDLLNSSKKDTSL